jgi:hypothetical protein
MSFRPGRSEQARSSSRPDAQAQGEDAGPQEQPGDAYVIAKAIDRAGMGGVASIALEIGRPLHWIGGQMAWVLEPILGAFGPLSRKGSMPIESIARLLERTDGAAELAGQLEEMRDKQEETGGRR